MGIINPGTLKKIQEGFKAGRFRLVLSDDEFKKRKEKIEKIAREYF